ncbi:hypothetical protein FGG08_002170 [Glutinoglossum americanum]|uniref:Rad60/SUMO-like domain-containing protein n=1 Tax=Glutinoglossum americanum TaxID=1670608 RepID=A0A9P8I5C7_9PEZI|nr:hypothetical protein FGG08_002170 [Glutinoglossum americanum]
MTNNPTEKTMPGAVSKRSLFKKPAWSKTQTAVDPVDFFSRSKEVYSDIVAEEERQRQKKFERRAKTDRKSYGSNASRKRVNAGSEDNSSSEDDDEDDSEDNMLKQRRVKPIPLSDSDDEYSRAPPPPVDDDDDNDDGKEFPKSLSRKIQNIVSTKRVNQSASRQPPQEPILLSDDEDNNHIDQHSAQTPKPSFAENTRVDQKSTEHSIQISDGEEEFPELARKARERARLKHIETEKATPEPSSPNAGIHKRPNSAQPQPSLVPLDPIVQIFISSRIPNTQPLIVNRRIGQRLRDVRLTWCDRQGNAVDRAAVLLTWRGKRVFDVTTCKSLGISADADGNVIWKGYEGGFGGDNRVHMEAMTEEILRDSRKGGNSGSGYSAGGVELAAKESEVEETSKAKDSVRLFLKSKGYPDFKLIVNPTTTIARVISAFRSHNKIDIDKGVSLQFDGDKLDPELTIADTELGDLDHVDVYVR